MGLVWTFFLEKTILKPLNTMKKLFVLLFFLTALLLSCEEQILDSNCWECEMRQTAEKTLHFTFCDKTEEEIHEYERLNTFDHNLNGKPWHQTTVCHRK
jgi:hypothetical protein